MATLPTVRYNNVVYVPVVDAHERRFASLVTAALPQTEEQWKAYASDLAAFYDAQLADMEEFRALTAALDGARENSDAIDATSKKLHSSNSIADAPAMLAAVSAYNDKVLFKLMPQIKKGQRALTKLYKLGKQHRSLKKKLEKARKTEVKRWFK